MTDSASAAAVRARTREALVRGDLLTAVSAWDGLSALAAAAGGCDSLVISGASVAASRLGLPDLGFLGLSDIEPVVRAVTAASQIPVLVDIDTGYGNAATAVRAMETLFEAGATGVIVEDQVFPKRCGLLDKQVVAREHFVQLVSVMAKERPAPDFLMVARTDSLAAVDLDEAIGRSVESVEAGADLTYIQGLSTSKQHARVAADVPGPRLHAYTAGEGQRDHQLGDLPTWGVQWLVLAAVTESAMMHGITAAVAAAMAGEPAPGGYDAATLLDMLQGRRWLSLLD